MYYEELKKELRKYSITNVRIYRFASWHSGFYYFTGEKKGVKLFIKICAGELNTVSTEAHLDRYYSFERHPIVIHYELEPFSWIATKFMPIIPINELKGAVDIDNIVFQMATILDELNSHGIIHRDLRPENICIDENGNLILIDFGWAIYKDKNWEKTSYEFTEKILNQQYRNSDGKFDDALSAFLSFKDVFESISEAELKPIADRIGRLVI